MRSSTHTCYRYCTTPHSIPHPRAGVLLFSLPYCSHPHCYVQVFFCSHYPIVPTPIVLFKVTSQTLYSLLTQKRNKLCTVSLEKNLGIACPYCTSLTFSETLYISEAQNDTKSSVKSGPLRFEKQNKQKKLV